MTSLEKYERLFPSSKSWRIWLEELRLMSINTRRQYLREFLRFLRRFNLDPERLYELRLHHLKSDDPRDRRIIEGWVRQMMEERFERLMGKAIHDTIKKTRDKDYGSYNSQSLR